MKQIILLATACITACVSVRAQHVGIGTTTPAFRLDVAGSINTDSVYRIGGNTVLTVKGTANTFTGVQSGIANSTGTENSAVGYRSLFSNATGS
ncbi:MAG TPA: hypothetical protein PLY26_09480, partial [Ferruginibacter sp.]|nr:hypothetical protein [Ferruginibacter sp.]